MRCGFLAILGVLALASPALAQNQDGAKADFEFAPETIEKSRPPSPTMQKALKLYAAKDYFSATIELHRVVEGQSGDSTATKQRAEFWMGKTLYRLGFYSASLSYFDRIVEKGDTHRYHSATLKWLASLSRQLPESVGILEKVGKYKRAELEQPALDQVRHELFYLLGRYHYRAGNFKEALGLFSSVPASSPFYARAKFMEGITHVRNYQAKPAARAFKALLRTAREAPKTKEIKDFKQLAMLSLARVFYSTGQYDLSIKYYDQVPKRSANWLPALFESAWSHFQRNNFSRALGNIHTLNAPYFDDYFFPESLVLRAVVYWKHCLWERSQEAINRFKAKYPALQRAVDQLLKQYADPNDFFREAQKIRARKAGLSPQVARLAGTALADRTLEKTFALVRELDRELKQVEAADPAWKATAVASVVLQDLSLQKSLAEREAGDLAQRRLKRLSGEIRELRKQAIKVEYEIINGKKNELEAAVRGELVKPTRTAREVRVDDEHELWPFDGQYWRDELGSYRYKIQSRCGS